MYDHQSYCSKDHAGKIRRTWAMCSAHLLLQACCKLLVLLDEHRLHVSEPGSSTDTSTAHVTRLHSKNVIDSWQATGLLSALPDIFAQMQHAYMCLKEVHEACQGESSDAQLAAPHDALAHLKPTPRVMVCAVSPA
jgi:hypothetical protein